MASPRGTAVLFYQLPGIFLVIFSRNPGCAWGRVWSPRGRDLSVQVKTWDVAPVTGKKGLRGNVFVQRGKWNEEEVLFRIWVAKCAFVLFPPCYNSPCGSTFGFGVSPRWERSKCRYFCSSRKRVPRKMKWSWGTWEVSWRDGQGAVAAPAPPAHPAAARAAVRWVPSSAPPWSRPNRRRNEDKLGSARLAVMILPTAK